MKSLRGGMTLFELLVVMIIIGVVYSIGVFTLKKEKTFTATMSVLTLKTTLVALSASSDIRMLCDTSCHECRIYSGNAKVLSTLQLDSDSAIYRYGFNRFGELKRLGDVVGRTERGLRQGCFELSLRPDGSTSPLILKSNQKFYAYTPLGGSKPYITDSEEALRKYIFNDSLYPLRGEDLYGAF